MEKEILIDEADEADTTLGKMVLSDSLRMYINEITAYPILSIEEQKKLASDKNYDLLIKCNLRLVVNIASHFLNNSSNLSLLDLIQEGNMGLIRATEDYDPEKAAFTTYASQWIRQKIENAIAKNSSVIYEPIKVVNLKRRYQHYLLNRRQMGLEAPTKEEVCRDLKITERAYNNLMIALTYNTVSLDTNFASEKRELEEVIEDPKDIKDDDLLDDLYNNELIAVLKHVLKPYHYFIIYNRVLRDHPITLKALSNWFEVSTEAIRLIQIKAVNKIKKYLNPNNKDFQLALEEIKKETTMIKGKFKKEAIEPIDIIKYLYVKDKLIPLERAFYKLILFGNYHFTDEDFIKLLNIKREELETLKKNVEEKLMAIFADREKFWTFKDEMLKSYGTKLYAFIDIKKDNVINIASDNLPDINAIKKVAVTYYQDENGLVDLDKKRDFYLFLKNTFSPLKFLILYCCVFEERVSLEEMAKYLSTHKDIVEHNRYVGMRLLKKYLQNDQENLIKSIEELKRKYGSRYPLLKNTPICKLTIIKYLYLKRYLDDNEQKILALELFGHSKYNLDDYAKILSLSINDTEKIYASLQEKINSCAFNSEEFREFNDKISLNYQARLYRLAIIDEPNLESFEELKKRCKK